ncbi:DUF3141 domain-containing protein [Acuticoccus kalidii]|uniref:DUF3141 domain-containing protein n=1 Tax=Acuticoccus kalidii TaxID=2910977 RepID=UPI003F6FC6F9
MRRRSDAYRRHAALPVPHVLDYAAELVLDGRSLPRPVNYLLARIRPPEGTTLDPSRRPFVVVDPRAGHGPGIGGFKADSEIGVAMKAGHPCYFIGFLPDPVPGQTIEDVALAEAAFLEEVGRRHAEADGRPCVIGNCQAGWAVMMLAAVRPELFGPIIVAGAPLSYWAGVKGRYPMRYLGGLLGGSWLTALASDLGAGVFDGAWLVQNFENQNPANTLWTKPYNLYAKVDTEAERYLGFERWWGGHVSLNAEEIQFIVDALFIGNRLTAGGITLDDTVVDLRNIRSPIVVFCSRGDNITPPQQALDWLLDLYNSVDEIRAFGQTIVYTIHDTIGHLGIFVSAGIARKEHDEFASNIDLIDLLPPGLYEAVFEPRAAVADHPELVTGDWAMRCEARTLDDIRALGGNDLADERRFAAAARMSDINLAFYRAFVQPFVRASIGPAVAETMRRLHPLRLGYESFGASNPWLGWVAEAAAATRKGRRRVAADNPWLSLQDQASRQIAATLDSVRVMAETAAEDTFRALYGSPALQAALGIDANSDRRPRKPARSLLHTRLIEHRIAALRAGMGDGGLPEALVRALVYVGMARGRVDERGFAAIRRLREGREDARALSLAAFKAMVRDQSYMLWIDEEAALAAIPQLLPADTAARNSALDRLASVLGASGALTGEAAARFDRIAALFTTPHVSDMPVPGPHDGPIAPPAPDLAEAVATRPDGEA